MSGNRNRKKDLVKEVCKKGIGNEAEKNSFKKEKVGWGEKKKKKAAHHHIVHLLKNVQVRVWDSEGTYWNPLNFGSQLRWIYQTVGERHLETWF